MKKVFDKEKVKLYHQLLIQSSGGSFGVRDEKLLESALENIFQTFDGQELYKTKEEKGAMLGYSLISNHAFIDGNKRIGMLVMLSFLESNGIHLSYKDEDGVKLGLGVASGKIDYKKLLEWIKTHKET
ncbi:MAG: type II toxin-antitoxin system death-on-curing family toxin [Clostridia bacterium]|nr:type II toxin-antitoxin system death-on-curing family toxin [Clostridia bacterium]